MDGGPAATLVRQAHMDNQNSGRDEVLSEVLRGWKVEGSLSPRFAENVWRRLAVQPTRINVWTQIQQWIVLASSRPAIAVAYMTALLSIGLAFGYWQGRQAAADTQAQLGARYLRAVDPYQRGLP